MSGIDRHHILRLAGYIIEAIVLKAGEGLGEHLDQAVTGQNLTIDFNVL
ncbi:hypothetical protein GR212_32930 [Rhizobium lusitanum]|uniref:Uncharacterized protein n=1 Tax=Rhizobium lusitanum TaxID=293958 RepID=A0A6L9UEG3_9HYPH|nr:hypothetical protein [Rhizobium lusitanum]NEI74363.1 hypothetical protein [Rhizobium lusitanum]